jgi:hypothetical protein
MTKDKIYEDRLIKGQFKLSEIRTTYLIAVLTESVLPIATHFSLAHDLELLALPWLLIREHATFLTVEISLVSIIRCS